jgi:uroporphyrin-III C-methyltransferase/precorrin-2 dehydrogenase/sirohydrochlorin ferrochelatase
LRLRLEALLPASLGTLAEKLQAAHDRLRTRFPDAAERRRALDSALGEAGALDPLLEGSADAVDSWIDGAAPETPGWRVVIELTSDDPDDLTLRQARLLGEADMLLVEPGIAPAILGRARADAVRHVLPFDEELPQGLVIELRRTLGKSQNI